MVCCLLEYAWFYLTLTLNSGKIDDKVLNDRYGWESVLTEEERKTVKNLYVINGKIEKPEQGLIITPVKDSIEFGFVVAMGYGVVKSIKEVYTMVKNNQKPIGPPYDPNGPRRQEGVDPNTLKPVKDLNTLDPQRIQNAVKYAGDESIQVYRDGTIYQGHHRVADAIKNRRAVDVFIEYMFTKN